MHSTNYYNTFVEIAEDCPLNFGEEPKIKAGKPTVASMQFEMIMSNPYKFTSDEVLFEIFANRNDISEAELKGAKEKFFSKGQACFRTSPLTKRYGFGVHFDPEGKMAIYGSETKAYKDFLENPEVKKVKAMRSSRKIKNLPL